MPETVFSRAGFIHQNYANVNASLLKQQQQQIWGYSVHAAREDKRVEQAFSIPLNSL